MNSYKLRTPLPLEVGNIVRLHVTDVAVHIDNDGNGHRRFGRRDGNPEQAEEMPLERVGEQIAAEHRKVDIRGIEHQLHRDEQRQQILPCEEAVDAARHHHDTDNQIMNYMYFQFHNRKSAKKNTHTSLPLAGNHNRPDHTRQQQYASHLERQHKAAVPRSGKRRADALHRQFYSLRNHVQRKAVGHREENHQRRSRQRRNQHRSQLAPRDAVAHVAVGPCEQDGEHIQHHDTPRIHHELYGAEERIAQNAVERPRAQQHEQQISSRPEDAPRGDRQHRADDDTRRHGVESNFL